MIWSAGKCMRMSTPDRTTMNIRKRYPKEFQGDSVSLVPCMALNIVLPFTMQSRPLGLDASHPPGTPTHIGP